MTDATPPYSAFGETFENVPTAMVYDTFTETAAKLSSRYMRLSDEATTTAERDAWWAKVLELRDVQRDVPAGDRDALIDHIHRWRADLKALLAKVEADSPDHRFHRLTKMQQTVLLQLADGLSTDQVAVKLGLTEQTVKNHLRAILRAYGMDTRSQVADDVRKYVETAGRG